MSSDQNDYNKAGLVTFVLSMVVTFGVMIYVVFLAGGIDLKEVRQEAAPTSTTASTPAAASVVGSAEAPKAADVSGVKEPWTSSDGMIAHGAQLYSVSCAMCHGAGGMGDGPAGMSLNPKARDFVEGKWKKGGTRLGLFDVISNGLPPSSMAAFAHLPVNDRWALVHYIRSITKNKVNDDDKEVAAAAAKLK